MEKTCLHCKNPISGRLDKKFCCDQCRNNYNNRINRERLPFIRQINRALLKNRKIIEKFKPNGKTIVKKEKLLVRGFNFNLFTHVSQEQNGNMVYFCYDFGYSPVGENEMRLIKLQDKKEILEP